MIIHPGKSILENIRATGGIEIESEYSEHVICRRDVTGVEKGDEFLGVKIEGEKVLLHQGRVKPYQGKILGLALDVCTTILGIPPVDLEAGLDVGKPMVSKNHPIFSASEGLERGSVGCDSLYCPLDGVSLHHM